MSASPLVSVWLITYNHEHYIAQALEGVLMQQTTFAVEIVVGEDYSTDRTRAIVEEYARRYPDRIRLFLSPTNMGMIPVLRPTFAMCRGKYVAMLDGDDYWTDPLKLQKQVEALEADSQRMFTFHQVQVLDEIVGAMYPAPTPRQLPVNGDFTLRDFLQPSHPVVTLSVLFRNTFAGALPEWYYELPYPDLALLILLLLEGGTAVYSPDDMGVYRIHAHGSFSRLNAFVRYEDRINFFLKLQPHLPPAYHQQVSRVIGFHYFELLLLAIRVRRFGQAFRYFTQMTSHDTGLIRFDGSSLPRNLLTMGLKQFSRLYRVLR
ncbi:glycosyltransferase family 2 protein [Hymenobacter busanensis]|uniref:Glycosyltransferase family 2 protein n=1 Tax=Hymenobacter busanensis TaxID=2607656 RepID=A0A7L4ZWC5_9BACT|nr:glycosyltransferase family 2 protein [Hymenobacter busanensis]KAA9332360.1 glycosyltransferase family 2 protein [Hymenobacter busanensis]QHJ07303.1 glycosyltransferase [Hymenobacter busanensis]